MTLSLVAASFFFLGHWLDLASGGAQTPVAQPSAPPFDTVREPPPLDLDPATAESVISSGGGEGGAASEL